ncbi:MAG TPA: MFS transporter [Anaerolineales bacterium]|nr:MFS transporter [Anaerolineales bacterium]
MFHNLKLPARFVYLFIEFSASLFFSMMFVVTSLYEATVAGLTPVQLILVGTTLEISAFVFEVPTGIVADVYSRRLSIIIGYLLMGLGFLIEGFFPLFLPILLAQAIWGLGYTFTSGATQAWITDEIGEDDANKLFLRGTQVGLFASLIGMGAAILVGANNVALPLRVGSFGVMLIGITLMLIMSETGFHPTPKENRNTWQHMWHTFGQGVKAARSRPRLMNIVFIGLFYGLYSEGFDRLWVKHLLDTFQLPILFGNNQVAFFAALRIAGTILTILAVRFVEKRVDASSPLAIGRAVLFVTAAISIALLGFALSPLLFLSISLYLVINVLRNVEIPLQTAWVNQKLDSQVRATVHSMFGQVDAIGQTLGGPIVAVIASVGSAVASLVTSSLLLTPALFFLGRANRPGTEDAPNPPLPETQSTD